MRTHCGKGVLVNFRRLLRGQRGISAVEFALIMPIMVTLFVGGTELTQGITIKRKTTIATRVIADLVSQSTTINNADMNTIFSASTAVLAPYPAGTMKMRITSVHIDSNNNARVVWSDGYNGATAYATKTPVTLPDGLNAFPNTTLIWAEAEYRYTPTIGYVISGSIDLKDKLYLRPRLASCVARNKGSGQPLCTL